MGKIKSHHLILCGLTIFSLLLNLKVMGTRSLWVDEIFSVTVAKSFTSMKSMLSTWEINMWFYYFLLFLWMKLGGSDFWIRILSLIFSTASIPLMYFLGKKIFDTKTSLFSCLLLSLQWIFVYYSAEARSYSLLIFLCILSTLTLIFSLEKPTLKFQFFYFISCVLISYTHIYGFFVVVSHSVALCFLPKQYRGLWLRYLTIYLLMGLCLTPLLYVGGQQADWIEKPNLHTIYYSMVVLFGGGLVPALGIGTLLLISGIHEKYKTPANTPIKNWASLLLISWLTVPVVISFIISIISTPIFFFRYLMVCIPAYVFWVSFGLISLQKKSLKIALGIIFIFFSSFILYNKVTENPYEDWKEISDYISNNSRGEDGVIFCSYFIKPSYDYYSDKKVPAYELAFGTYDPGGGELQPYPNRKLLAEIKKKHKRLWLISLYNYKSNFDYLCYTLEDVYKYQFSSLTKLKRARLYLYEQKPQ